MKNPTIYRMQCETYTAKAYTHNYIFTFCFAGNFYALTLKNVSAEMLMTMCKQDKASRGAGFSVRFKPTNREKIALVNMGAKVICSVEFFNSECASNKYNKGENAEKMVTEQMFGQPWVKDSVPFTVAGDIEANGCSYQHKHEGATFCNEKTLASLAYQIWSKRYPSILLRTI